MLRFGTREIALAAIMAALVAASTLLIQVPIPATQGFFNVGDAMVMVAALTFGPIVGFFAGGFGSALADLIGGWYVWVPFTLVIKGLEGFLAGSIVVLDDEGGGVKTKIFAWIVAGARAPRPRTRYFLFQSASVSHSICTALFNANLARESWVETSLNGNFLLTWG